MKARRCGFVLTILLATLPLVFAPSPASGGNNMALAPGDTVPVLRGFRSDGSPIRTVYADNKLTLINFWATWCEPCKDEMPALQKLHEAHGDSGLGIIGVMNDNVGLEAMQRFVDALGVTYTVALPHKETGRKWKGVSVLPATFLIDEQGILVRRYVGATEEQVQGLVRDVEAFLEGRPLESMVIPEAPATATEADRSRALEEKKKQ
jgi:thiol-disulfide isomerase/thioredoxin